MANLQEPNQWLTLSQAARILGVHTTTLRRWADNGDIPYLLTPGGHRRFSLQDVEQFAANHKQENMPVTIEQVWVEQALTQTRKELVVREDKPWLTVQDDTSREEHRILGRRLLGLTLQYISDPAGNGSLLAEAAFLGREYGHMALATGLPLSDALQATIFFRDMLMETSLQLPESAQITPTANLRLMRRINKLLNTVQIAIAEAYEQPSHS
ncbi:MAG: helix-turn-helix domain-containing protein [Candidatus Promineifilaceae bacterium]